MLDAINIVENKSSMFEPLLKGVFKKTLKFCHM